MPAALFLSPNRACEEVSGYSSEEVVGRPFCFLLLPEDVEPVRNVFNNLATRNEPSSYENYWVTKTGQRRWISFSNRPLLGADGKPLYVLSTGIDVTEQRHAEEALRQSEQRWRHALDAARFGAWDHDLLTGEVIWSQNAHVICGLPPRSMESVWEANYKHIHPDDQQIVRRAVQRALQSKRQYAVDFRILHSDGGIIWLHIQGQVLRDSAGNPVRMTGVFFDITERRRVEATRAQLASIVESSEDAIIGHDLDGIITSWNDAAVRMFGYSAAEAIGRPISFLRRPDEFDGMPLLLDSVKRGRRIHHFETYLVRKDGQRVHVSLAVSPIRDGAGKVIGMSRIVRDVREREKARQAVREIEARMAALVNTADDGIITIDERGIIESLNPACERLFGYKAEQLIGRSIDVLMADTYTGHHRAHLRKYLHTGQAKVIGTRREVQAKRKDGSVFPMELGVSQVRLGSRRIFTGILHDITGRRQLEKQILDVSTNEQRRVGQDLHDGLCQHLAAIGYGIEAIRRNLTERNTCREDDIKAIAQLVDEAMTQARGLARGLCPMRLDNEGLVAALRELASHLSDAFSISCIVAGNENIHLADAEAAIHLYRIAQEAASNAIKHGKARRVVIRFTESSGELAMTIEDNGCGIGQIPTQSKGMGLHIMNYRARMIGATFDIRPMSPRGTIVTCIARSVAGPAGGPSRRPRGK